MFIHSFRLFQNWLLFFQRLILFTNPIYERTTRIIIWNFFLWVFVHFIDLINFSLWYHLFRKSIQNFMSIRFSCNFQEFDSKGISQCFSLLFCNLPFVPWTIMFSNQQLHSIFICALIDFSYPFLEIEWLSICDIINNNDPMSTFIKSFRFLWACITDWQSNSFPLNL